MKNEHLYILWTSGDSVTAEKMVFMYAVNSLKKNWWDKVTLVVWGAAAQLVGQDAKIQKKLKEAQEIGVHVTACKACADQLGVTETMEKLGVEVIYWGGPLTEVLKKGEKLLTI